ncbi:uncharacterized protein LOC131981072 [Centropristis striata]|uniref:uncharacterized protein LOC131981072 n=1 Tax=Centropristis striata TaxID=184440 RepID=UPI0027E12BE8|nr:uncharacterized protein LOC131981072 [Centropristis striata]
MGNKQCATKDVAILASVARDVCPFPDYRPSPLFVNMLSINSSLHLRNHYREVQSSLTPKQLDDFTQGLRTTFGREGKVTLGGVGVVALSLAVLFDTLARQVRGEWVSDSGPIPGLFLKDPRGFYPPHAKAISEYLRLVPYIANNPSRMIEESKRYYKEVMIETVDKNQSPTCDDIYVVNSKLEKLFEHRLHIYLLQVTNSTVVKEIVKSVRKLNRMKGNPVQTRYESGPEISTIFNLNCDPDAATAEFLSEVNKSNKTKKAFKRCRPQDPTETWLPFIARLALLDVVQGSLFLFDNIHHSLKVKREDFDLKDNALRKWAE